MKTTTPTPEEIKACAAHFREIAPKIVQRSFFGDDNRKRIDIQADILERIDAYGDEDEVINAFDLDMDDDYELYCAAMDAFAWTTGDYDEADGKFPESWDSLIRE